MENRWEADRNELKPTWLRRRVDAQGHGLLPGEADRIGARLPVTALVDRSTPAVEARGGKRWDHAAALIQLLLEGLGRRPSCCAVDEFMTAVLLPAIRSRPPRAPRRPASGNRKHARPGRSAAPCAAGRGRPGRLDEVVRAVVAGAAGEQHMYRLKGVVDVGRRVHYRDRGPPQHHRRGERIAVLDGAEDAAEDKQQQHLEKQIKRAAS